jgi:hypothetical protein
MVPADLGDLVLFVLLEDRLDDGAQKSVEPPDEEVEVESGGGHDGVDAVAVTSFEIIAAHPVFGFEMTDNGLDGGSSFHLAFE